MKTIIELHCLICQCNDTRFLEGKQRLSNNNCPKFTDEELITVYLWGKHMQLPTRKAIYNYAKMHLVETFPNIPSYQAFCRRLNRLAGAFRALAEIWAEQAEAKNQQTNCYVLDACPIMVSRGPRCSRAKVASGFCNKTRNATRNEWYYGVKLHVFGRLQPGKLPVPCAMQITPASHSDLWPARQIMYDCAPISNGTLFADRGYIDKDWKEELQHFYNIKIITPRKKIKFDPIKSGDAFSTQISSVRQPIESLFNWINARTGIQRASHVRSYQGLLFHVFSSLAVACFIRCFNY